MKWEEQRGGGKGKEREDRENGVMFHFSLNIAIQKCKSASKMLSITNTLPQWTPVTPYYTRHPIMPMATRQ